MSKGVTITLVKSPDGLFHPFTEHDRTTASKIPVGEDNVFRLQRIRNPRHHRKFFALIKLAFENQDEYKDIDVFRKVMQMRAGYFDTVVTEKKVTLYLPKSISYGELDQIGFQELYEKTYVEITKFLKIEKEKDREVFDSELAGFG